MSDWTARYDCVFGRCKMVNLCKGSHCVGASLDRQGFKVDGFGNIVEKSEYDDPVTPADATDVGSPVLTHEKGGL